ncbi:MAG: hypothetical protein JWM93_141, partial [Frankiales bacterium]|nr:hypothetical protein [Frankiales bacterium]
MAIARNPVRWSRAGTGEVHGDKLVRPVQLLVASAGFVSLLGIWSGSSATGIAVRLAVVVGAAWWVRLVAPPVTR